MVKLETGSPKTDQMASVNAAPSAWNGCTVHLLPQALFKREGKNRTNQDHCWHRDLRILLSS